MLCRTQPLCFKFLTRWANYCPTAQLVTGMAVEREPGYIIVNCQSCKPAVVTHDLVAIAAGIRKS